MSNTVPGERLELLARIAALYFEDGLTQAEIASQTGYSRSMVSRLLSEARQQKVVEIRIHHPLDRRGDIEQTLQDRLNLKTVRVLARGTLNDAQMLRRLGALAAHLVEELVEDHMLLGVSWGTGVFETVNALRPRPLADIHVVQFIGSLGTPDPEIDGPELARRLARTFGGRYSILPAPLFVESEVTREALLNNQRVSRVLALAQGVTLALVGIGTVEPDASSLRRAGYLSAEQIGELAQAGAVGDVCAIHFDRLGQLVDVPLTRRVVGIDAATLVSIPTKIGVAGGQAKALPIVGACRARLVNVLVTDEVSAAGVLRILNGTEQL